MHRQYGLKKVVDLELKARADLEPAKKIKDLRGKRLAIVRRLRRKLKGETLAEFSQHWNVVVTTGGPLLLTSSPAGAEGLVYTRP